MDKQIIWCGFGTPSNHRQKKTFTRCLRFQQVVLQKNPFSHSTNSFVLNDQRHIKRNRHAEHLNFCFERKMKPATTKCTQSYVFYALHIRISSSNATLNSKCERTNSVHTSNIKKTIFVIQSETVLFSNVYVKSNSLAILFGVSKMFFQLIEWRYRRDAVVTTQSIKMKMMDKYCEEEIFVQLEWFIIIIIEMHAFRTRR